MLNTGTNIDERSIVDRTLLLIKKAVSSGDVRAGDAKWDALHELDRTTGNCYQLSEHYEKGERNNAVIKGKPKDRRVSCKGNTCRTFH